MARKLDDAGRATYAAFADFLIPAHGKMPSSSDAGVASGLLDDVLRLRPDIEEAFFRGLDALVGKDPKAAANELYKSDEEAFNALSLAASAAYYMAPGPREALGYPGQESLTYDAHAVPDYLTDGLLERVVRRGTIYKPTS